MQNNENEISLRNAVVYLTYRRYFVTHTAWLMRGRTNGHSLETSESRYHVFSIVTRSRARFYCFRVSTVPGDLSFLQNVHIGCQPTVLALPSARGLFRSGLSGRCVRPPTHVHLAPRLRTSGSTPTFPPFDFMACIRTVLFLLDRQVLWIRFLEL